MYDGYTHSAQLNLNDNQPIVTVTLVKNNINGEYVPNVPLIQPYGFCSIPMDNISCDYSSLGSGFYGVYVNGYAVRQGDTSNLSGMIKGETATYNSTNFTRQLKQNGAFDVFTGAIDKITTAAINGGNTNQILIDLCAEIKALETFINNFITNRYNTHLHSGVQTGSGNSAIPTVTATSYLPTGNFNRDESFLNESPNPNLINNDGKVLA